MKYIVPAKTEVSIAKDDGNKRWRRHVVRITTEFARYVSTNSGAYVFAKDGWLMLVRCDRVEHLG